MSAPIALSDYGFTAPPQWSRQDLADHIELRSPDSGCLILLLQAQPGSGDLEKDAQSVFELMYPGAAWQRRNADEKAFTLVRGFTAQGLPYCLLDAEMSTTGADGFHPERGVAWVIQAGSEVAIVAARHNDFFAAHGNCYGKYDYWPRFFDSFCVGRGRPDAVIQPDLQSRLVGRWQSEEGGAAIGEYVFRNDGTYLRGGGVGTTSVTSDDRYEYTTHTTYSGEGDGSFSVEGNRLLLAAKGGGGAEEILIRIVEVNEGGSAWQDRLCMVKSDVGGAYEVHFARVA